MLSRKLNIKYNNEADEFCRQYELSQNEHKRYIFGMNKYAQDLAKIFNIVGFVDDYAIETEFMDKKIIRSDALPAGSMVVVCVLDRFFTVSKKLQSLNIKHLDYYAFSKYTSATLKALEYWIGFEDDYYDNFDKYNDIYKLLYDSESKEIFKKLINFRLSYDITYMEDFKFRIHEQYFEDFLDLNENDAIFADIGGFDGQTTLEFIKRYPKYSGVYFFEPDKDNYTIAQVALSKFDYIHMYQLGLSNKKEQLKFASLLGQSSKIDEFGCVTIEVDRYDNIVKMPVTFIKIDIEGAESDAIDGMSESILMYQPAIAIAIYHRCDDFWKIPNQILSICEDYKLFIRHYTEGLGETVMFFIPKNSPVKETKE